MTDTKTMGVMSYLMSSEAKLTIIIPIIIYNIAFWTLGAGAALIITACYSGLLEMFSKRVGSLAIIALILVSGTIHYLYIKGYTFFGLNQEAVFLSVGGSLSVVLVFGFYSLIGKPVVRTQAENAIPELTQLSFYGTKKYTQVWQEISLVWIITYVLKAIFIVFLSKHYPELTNRFVFMGAWPLTLLMIVFSFYWPKCRWTKMSSDQAV